jgi:hypothetical protein
MSSDRSCSTSGERGVREWPPIKGKANVGGADHGGGRMVAVAPISTALVALRSAGSDAK